VTSPLFMLSLPIVPRLRPLTRTTCSSVERKLADQLIFCVVRWSMEHWQLTLAFDDNGWTDERRRGVTMDGQMREDVVCRLLRGG